MYGFVGRCGESITDKDTAFTSEDTSFELMENNSLETMPCTLCMALLAGMYGVGIIGEDTAFTSEDKAHKLMEDNGIESVTCSLWMALLADVDTSSLMKLPSPLKTRPVS